MGQKADRGSSNASESDSSSMAKNPNMSELVPDVLASVLERLSFKDFHRARMVCSSWYSASKLCMLRRAPCPWLILFPDEEPTDDYYCLLLNPHDDREKFYRIGELGVDFARSRYLANSGNWFLMFDHRSNYYVFNMFTRKRIDLPPVETLQEGQMSFERRGDNDFILTLRNAPYGIEVSTPVNGVRADRAVLWVDEGTEDYVVLWMLDLFMAFCRKGDTKWREVPTLEEGCMDMAFKDNKLYLLSSRSRSIRVLDFSGDCPKEAGESNYFPPLNPDGRGRRYWNATSFAFTQSGDVALVAEDTGRNFAGIYKMNSEATEWEKVESLDGEALVVDVGVIVPAIDGIKENSIYVSNNFFRRFKELSLTRYYIDVVHLKTRRSLWFRLCDSSSPKCKDARWFFPSFAWR